MHLDNRNSAYVKYPLPAFLIDWARQVNIQLVPSSKQANYELIYKKDILQLSWLGEENFSPIFVEMPRSQRLKASNLLLRAIGNNTRHVIDLTAGLGTDALTLATCGRPVTCVERCAPIALLLFDGIRRNSGLIANNIGLYFADSRQWLSNLHSELDTIYIDTMFVKKKNSKPNKSMQILKLIAGDDPDAEMLFLQALKSKARRVVVKHSDDGHAFNPKPNAQYQGKTVRFDVYNL